MKYLVVLVLLLSGLGFFHAQTQAARVHGTAHSLSSASRVSDLADGHPRTGEVGTPLLLLGFGGVMFLSSWICVLWSSWKSRHAAWDSLEPEAYAEAS